MRVQKKLATFWRSITTICVKISLPFIEWHPKGFFLKNPFLGLCHLILVPPSAEITKLAVNCFVTMKVSYANMIGDIADATPGADKNHILQAVGADSRVGTKYLRPGYGFGGPCFPRDNRALGGYARFF